MRLLRIARGSRTARSVAALRAGFEGRPSTPGGDEEAQRRLARGMRPGRAVRLREHLLARTAFFDRVVLDALARGIDQVVIVGAGYDDRALRFRSSGVRFFEVDHPRTQADKRRRLRRLSQDMLTLVPVDLEHDSPGASLALAGHSDARATLFICEGVLVYLEAEKIAELLSALAGRAAAGSELAVSLATHAPGLPTQAVLDAANAARSGAGREPWRTILPRDAHLELLRSAGWVEAEVLDDADIRPAAPRGRSLLVRAHPAADTVGA